MRLIKIEVPEEVKNKIKSEASKRGLTMKDFIVSACNEKIVKEEK